MAARVFLVDDHDIVRRGLASLLDADPGLEFAGEASSSEEAMRALMKTQVDVALVDISLGGANGLELVKGLAASKPELPVLVVSMHDESVYAERAVRAGARGYCAKHASLAELRGAIKTVLSGRIHLSPAMTARMLERMQGGGAGPGDPMEELTDRELEVLEHIGQGSGTRAIAEALHLSVKTVESHRANIKRKLHVKSAPELVRRAVLYTALP